MKHNNMKVKNQQSNYKQKILAKIVLTKDLGLLYRISIFPEAVILHKN